MSNHPLIAAASCVIAFISVLGTPAALADNQPVAGSGCAEAANAGDLGSVADHLSWRKYVSIGVDSSTPMLDDLRRTGKTATLEEFLAPAGLTAAQVSNDFVLLVSGRRFCSRNRTEEAAIARGESGWRPHCCGGFRERAF